VDGIQSALIVSVEIPQRIERIRQRHVQVARSGVPAHVTILFPFAVPSTLGARDLASVARIAGDTPAFPVRFARVARFEGALWLDPVPVEPFRSLIRAAAAAFPAYPPYGGIHAADPVPHLTIALGTAATFDGLQAEVEAHLPFDVLVEAIELIVEGHDGRWRREERFALRP
jgi:2'-5' RNA ligase